MPAPRLAGRASGAPCARPRLGCQFSHMTLRQGVAYISMTHIYTYFKNSTRVLRTGFWQCGHSVCTAPDLRMGTHRPPPQTDAWIHPVPLPLCLTRSTCARSRPPPLPPRQAQASLAAQPPAARQQLPALHPSAPAAGTPVLQGGATNHCDSQESEQKGSGCMRPLQVSLRADLPSRRLSALVHCAQAAWVWAC